MVRRRLTIQKKSSPCSLCPLWCPLVLAFPSQLYLDRESLAFCARPQCYLWQYERGCGAPSPQGSFAMNTQLALTTRMARRAGFQIEPKLQPQKPHSPLPNVDPAPRAAQKYVSTNPTLPRAQVQKNMRTRTHPLPKSASICSHLRIVAVLTFCRFDLLTFRRTTTCSRSRPRTHNAKNVLVETDLALGNVEYSGNTFASGSPPFKGGRGLASPSCLCACVPSCLCRLKISKRSQIEAKVQHLRKGCTPTIVIAETMLFARASTGPGAARLLE